MSTAARTSGLAIASFTLALLSIFLWVLTAIPAVICGHVARSEIRSDPSIRGHSFATAGLIIGYLFLVIFILLLLLFSASSDISEWKGVTNRAHPLSASPPPAGTAPPVSQ